jgi:hypothetical protein
MTPVPADRPLADRDAAARKIVEIANDVEAVQDGRPAPALVFPMPFPGLPQARRFIFAAERYPPSRRKMTHQRPFLSH